MNGSNEPLKENALVNGRYQLIALIGRGGMGEVWRARDTLLDRLVAIKVMSPPSLHQTELRVWHERARREALAAARVDHPNVVRIYDVVDTGDRLWIVMELLTGRSLATVVRDLGPPGVAETIRIGLGLATALRQVHAAGVLHRDVKPDNVLLEPGGRVVLMDFGIAALNDLTDLTVTGMLVGTIGYLAPERVTSGAHGPASDLWSLGATLYQTLTGHPLFLRESAFEVLTAVVMEDPVLHDASGPLRPLLEGLLRKNPEERPSADQVIDELTRLNRQQSGTGSPGPHWYGARSLPPALTPVPPEGPIAATTSTEKPDRATTHLAPVTEQVPEAPPPIPAPPVHERHRPADTAPDSAGAPRVDPSVPRSYIPRKPATAFPHRPRRTVNPDDEPDHRGGGSAR